MTSDLLSNYSESESPLPSSQKIAIPNRKREDNKKEKIDIFFKRPRKPSRSQRKNMQTVENTEI